MDFRVGVDLFLLIIAANVNGLQSALGTSKCFFELMEFSQKLMLKTQPVVTR